MVHQRARSDIVTFSVLLLIAVFLVVFISAIRTDSQSDNHHGSTPPSYPYPLGVRPSSIKFAFGCGLAAVGGLLVLFHVWGFDHALRDTLYTILGGSLALFGLLAVWSSYDDRASEDRREQSEWAADEDRHHEYRVAEGDIGPRETAVRVYEADTQIELAKIKGLSDGLIQEAKLTGDYRSLLAQFAHDETMLATCLKYEHPDKEQQIAEDMLELRGLRAQLEVINEVEQHDPAKGQQMFRIWSDRVTRR